MRLVCAEGSIYRTEMWYCVVVDFSLRAMSSRLSNAVNQTDGKVVSGPVAPVQLSQSVEGELTLDSYRTLERFRPE